MKCSRQLTYDPLIEHVGCYSLLCASGLPFDVVEWSERLLFVLGDSERRLQFRGYLADEYTLKVIAENKLGTQRFMTLNPRSMLMCRVTPYTAAVAACDAFLRCSWRDDLVTGSQSVPWEHYIMWPLHSRLGRFILDRSPSRLRPKWIKTREFSARRLFWRLYWIERQSQ